MPTQPTSSTIVRSPSDDRLERALGAMCEEADCVSALDVAAAWGG